jgi:hypothetical protein
MVKFRRHIFDYFSIMAVRNAVKGIPQLQKMWDLSTTVLPDLSDHFAMFRVGVEDQVRLRLLLCAQAIFISQVVNVLKMKGGAINSWVDVGDSDGAARLLFLKSMPQMKNFKTFGINMELDAVKLMRSKGLEAECMNAMDLHKKGVSFDIVSVFETLEHMPDPIGFLERISQVVGQRLVVSVPLIRVSRIGLNYLTSKWNSEWKPGYSNNHFFELAPLDWCKLFNHAGWRVESEWKVYQFPRSGPLKWVMSYAWRKISFEGFWFVSLKKDSTFSNRFSRG